MMPQTSSIHLFSLLDLFTDLPESVHPLWSDSLQKENEIKALGGLRIIEK